MTVRNYSSRSQQTTLSTGVNASATSITVGSASNLLGGISGASLSVTSTFTIVIDPDTALEEIVDVTGVSGNVLTIIRGVETNPVTGQSHSAGAVVRHMAIGRDYREANEHSEKLRANSATAHGIPLATIVLTSDTGTVNSTMIANDTIVNADIKSDAAIVDTKLATISTPGKVANAATTATSANTNSAIVARDASGNFTASTITAGAVTGLNTPAGNTDATNKSYVDGILGSATSAASSASAAASSASAASTSASNAATSASAASASASTATTQATNAASSASAASTSATNAAASESAASASASTATTQATNASNSATAAASSASAASTSATNAANSATNSASSATAAAGSATSASNSVTAIADQTGRGLVRDMGDITTPDTTTDTYIGINAQVSAATTQATNSANSATASANSATAAATSATNSANSATASANSATAAAASLDSFDDRYLGAKASAPSVDNDGNALLTGALYFNSTTPGMYVWTGSTWTVMATSGDIESVAAGTGLSGGGTAGAVTVSLDTSSVYVVPSQTSHSGKFLTTDGTSASWVSISDWGTL